MREGRKLMKNHVPWQYSKEDIVHYAPTASLLHQVRPIDNALLQAQLPPLKSGIVSNISAPHIQGLQL